MKLSQAVSESFLTKEKIADLRQQFVKNKPFPYLELKNFFTQEFAINVLKQLAQEQFYDKESDLFRFQQTNDLVSSDNEEIQKIRNFFISNEFINYMENLTGLKLARDKMDFQGSMYQDTDFLLVHDDQLDGRKIAFLLYLSNMNDDEGGALELFDLKNKKPNVVVKKIVPKFNTFAFFEVSDISFHAVEEVVAEKQRIALGGWYHGK